MKDWLAVPGSKGRVSARASSPTRNAAAGADAATAATAAPRPGGDVAPRACTCACVWAWDAEALVRLPPVMAGADARPGTAADATVRVPPDAAAAAAVVRVVGPARCAAVWLVATALAATADNMVAAGATRVLLPPVPLPGPLPALLVLAALPVDLTEVLGPPAPADEPLAALWPDRPLLPLLPPVSVGRPAPLPVPEVTRAVVAEPLAPPPPPLAPALPPLPCLVAVAGGAGERPVRGAGAALPLNVPALVPVVRAGAVAAVAVDPGEWRDVCTRSSPPGAPDAADRLSVVMEGAATAGLAWEVDALGALPPPSAPPPPPLLPLPLPRLDRRPAIAPPGGGVVAGLVGAAVDATATSCAAGCGGTCAPTASDAATGGVASASGGGPRGPGECTSVAAAVDSAGSGCALARADTTGTATSGAGLSTVVVVVVAVVALAAPSAEPSPEGAGAAAVLTTAAGGDSDRQGRGGLSEHATP